MTISFPLYYILAILTLTLRKSTHIYNIHSEKLFLLFWIISSIMYFTTILMLSWHNLIYCFCYNINRDLRVFNQVYKTYLYIAIGKKKMSWKIADRMFTWYYMLLRFLIVNVDHDSVTVEYIEKEGERNRSDLL